jgi:hypothetical protein
MLYCEVLKAVIYTKYKFDSDIFGRICILYVCTLNTVLLNLSLKSRYSVKRLVQLLWPWKRGLKAQLKCFWKKILLYFLKGVTVMSLAEYFTIDTRLTVMSLIAFILNKYMFDWNVQGIKHLQNIQVFKWCLGNRYKKIYIGVTVMSLKMYKQHTRVTAISLETGVYKLNRCDCNVLEEDTIYNFTINCKHLFPKISQSLRTLTVMPLEEYIYTKYRCNCTIFGGRHLLPW